MDVLVRQHFALIDALRRVAGNQQMFLDGLSTELGAARLGLNDAENTVGVAHRGYLRVRNDQRFVGKGQGHDRAALDACRRITDHIVEAHVFELLENLFDAFLCQCLLVTSLRSREYEKVPAFAVLILDQRLGECCFAVQHIDKVIDDTAFTTHDQIEVAQADVEVNDGSFVTA